MGKKLDNKMLALIDKASREALEDFVVNAISEAKKSDRKDLLELLEECIEVSGDLPQFTHLVH